MDANQIEGKDYIIIDPTSSYAPNVSQEFSEKNAFPFDDEYESEEEVEYSNLNRVEFVLQHRYSNFILMMKHQKEHPSLYFSHSDITSEKQIFWNCDQCRKGIDIHETHYNCFECIDFDLCSKCFAKHSKLHISSLHPHSNLFVKITEPIHEKKAFVISHHQTKNNSSISVVERAFATFSDWPCIGERNPHNAKQIIWYTYSQLWKQIQTLSSVLQEVLAPKSLIGFGGENCKELVVTDLACLYGPFISVPIPHTLTTEELISIFKQTELSCVICTEHFFVQKLQSLLEQFGNDFTKLKLLLVISSSTTKNLPCAIQTIRIADFATIIAKQKKNKQKPCYRESNDLISIVYSSGSTGTPKGACFTESLWFQEWIFAQYPYSHPTVSVIFLPLAHMTGRNYVMGSIINGGRIFFNQHLEEWKLDLEQISPTRISLVPRIANLIYHDYTSIVEQRYQQSATTPIKTIRKQVKQEIRQQIASKRVISCSIGTAPTTATMKLFLKQLFQIPLYEGYGTTESAAITTDEQIVPNIQVKLVSLPQLGYLITDTPFPRGEVLVKTKHQIPYYFKDTNNTILDEQGFGKTGDVGEWKGGNKLTVIDRVNHVSKVANGEFINAEKIELQIMTSPFILQAFVYANSLYHYLVAVIVPTITQMKKNEMRNKIQKELLRISQQFQWRPCEQIKDFLIEMEPFTPDNGKLTLSNKMCRHKLKQCYSTQLLQLLQQQKENSIHLEAIDKLELFWKLVKRCLQSEEKSENTFMELGGDSIAAVMMSQYLWQYFQLHISAKQISYSTMQELCNQVMQTVQPNESDEWKELKYSKGIIQKERIQLPLMLQQQLKELLFKSKLISTSSQIVLLTGASGFLGKHLLYELLKETDIIVHVVVRGSSLNESLLKLTTSIRNKKIQAKVIQAIETKQLHVWNGDVSKDQLGLSDQIYEKLCKECTTVIHNAATVNHIYALDDLFDDNVKSTWHCMKICCTHSIKPLHFISTSSIPSNCTAVDGSKGYVASKWIAEMILIQSQIPFSIYRLGFLLNTNDEDCEVNNSDWFVRLWSCIVESKIVPHSFYFSSHAKFEGLPVDSVAGWIISNVNNRQNVVNQIYTVNSFQNWNLDTLSQWYQQENVSAKVLLFKDWFLAMSDNKNFHPISHLFSLPLISTEETTDNTVMAVQNSNYQKGNFIALLNQIK